MTDKSYYKCILSLILTSFIDQNMNLPAIIITFTVSFVIALLWVKGIDNMKRKHPNYKGEDFLDWDKNKEDEN